MNNEENKEFKLRLVREMQKFYTDKYYDAKDIYETHKARGFLEAMKIVTNFEREV